MLTLSTAEKHMRLSIDILDIEGLLESRKTAYLEKTIPLRAKSNHLKTISSTLEDTINSRSAVMEMLLEAIEDTTRAATDRLAHMRVFKRIAEGDVNTMEDWQQVLSEIDEVLDEREQLMKMFGAEKDELVAQRKKLKEEWSEVRKELQGGQACDEQACGHCDGDREGKERMFAA